MVGAGVGAGAQALNTTSSANSEIATKIVRFIFFSSLIFSEHPIETES
jgi:hypothetical protein